MLAVSKQRSEGRSTSKQIDDQKSRAVINWFLSPSQGTELAQFRRQILSAHNSKRLLHRVPPLTEDEKLNRDAQSFAMKLARQRNLQLMHSPLQDRVGKGENIAIRCSLKGMSLSIL